KGISNGESPKQVEEEQRRRQGEGQARPQGQGSLSQAHALFRRIRPDQLRLAGRFSFLPVGRKSLPRRNLPKAYGISLQEVGWTRWASGCIRTPADWAVGQRFPFPFRTSSGAKMRA
ncbi:MAG: hypothetical protein NTW19_08295, partial [Planctomycetota bacterium]|nr:hypothetical protein [Planctomycetota bacterium]